jgi:hypothetical protein
MTFIASRVDAAREMSGYALSLAPAAIALLPAPTARPNTQPSRAPSRFYAGIATGSRPSVAAAAV